MNGQISLEEYIEKDPLINTTCVIVDGECRDLDWRDLFDGNKFNEISCVTFVSSADFFFKATEHFQSIKVIIGIDKEDVRKAIAENVLSYTDNQGTSFFEKLSDLNKQKVIDKKIDLRYSKPGQIIHSKIYLLTNTLTGNNRLIIGSANFTNTAFECGINQYEEVLVFDNSNLFEIYSKRFEFLYSQTEEYIPRETIEKYKNGKFISLVDLTLEEKTDRFIDTIKEHNIVPVCNERILDYVDTLRDQEEKENANVKATFEVIASLGKRKRGNKSGQYELKTNDEIAAQRDKTIDILFRHTKAEMEINRYALTFNESDKKQYRLFGQNEKTSRDPEVIDRQATDSEIRKSIGNLTKFISAYEKYVSNHENTVQNLSRIFEIIMYSFASAYIFKFRQEAVGNKADIPIVLVIGGRASSGKSNMLAYIDRILSGRKLPFDKHFLQYKMVDKGGKLGDLFVSENTYPLLVDEVSTSFFNSKSANKGEELIKYLANTLNSKHPVMICTTNTTAFNIPAQVARRIYFIKVDACFDENKKSEANKYYDSVMNEANNTLFRDFCFRMGEKIKAGESMFGINTADYLSVVREIFIDYYRISNMNIPDYFPRDIYNDYESRGRDMWRTLYDQEQKSFIYKYEKGMKEPTLTVKVKELVTGNRQDAQVYMNYLKQDILNEDAGVYVVLRATPFLEWIGIKRKRKLREMIKRVN